MLISGLGLYSLQNGVPTYALAHRVVYGHTMLNYEYYCVGILLDCPCTARCLVHSFVLPYIFMYIPSCIVILQRGCEGLFSKRRTTSSFENGQWAAQYKVLDDCFYLIRSGCMPEYRRVLRQFFQLQQAGAGYRCQTFICQLFEVSDYS